MNLVLGKLSLTMEAGQIVKWLVDDGASVHEGQILVEVETDKATAEVEAPASGRLRIVAAEGDTVSVGGLLAEIDGGGAV